MTGHSAVFLSYASQDSEAARRISDTLHAAGIEVWFDQSELRGGDAWDAKIRKQIKECALFVPIISANTQARLEGYFRIEWKLAAQRTHAMADAKPFLVPIVLDGTSDADAHVPDEFRAVQWMRIAGGDSLHAFGERVREMLSAPSSGGTRSSESAKTVSPHGRPAPRELGPPAGRRKAIWIAAALTAVALMVIWGIFFSRPKPGVAPGRITSLAVKPLDNFAGDASQAYLSDGMTEALCASLGSIGSLRVPGRTSVMRYKATDKTIREIAGELKVDAIVEGSVQLAGQRILVTVQLVEAATDRHVWAASYERDLSDFFNVQREVARAVAREVSARLTPEEQRRLAQAPAANPEAVQAYLKGVHFTNQWTTESTKTAIEQLVQATKLEPRFAPAHAALALAYITAAYKYARPVEAIAKAESAARESVRLDPELSDAQTALGAVLLHLADWNRADAAFREALRLNERNAMAHDWFAWYLGARGRVDEGISHMKRALELEPQSILFNPDMTFMLIWARRYPEAVRQADATLKLDRASYQGHEGRGWALILQGDFAAGIASLEEARRLDDSSVIRSQLGSAHARAGNRAEAERFLAELLVERQGTGYVRADIIAELHAAMGKKDEAFAWLEIALAEKAPHALWLQVSSYYDPLRSDPRFAAALQKLGLK